MNQIKKIVFLTLISLFIYVYMVFTNVTINCYLPLPLDVKIYQNASLGLPDSWFKDYSWYFLHSMDLNEKIANFAVILPNSVWSSVSIDDLLAKYLIFVLFLPLIYCFFSLLYLIWNQVKYVLWGWLNSYESKDINFTFLTRNYWWVMWSYAYDIVPRFTTYELLYDNYKIFKKFPSPTATFAFLDRIFLLQDRINYLVWFTYFFLVCCVFFVHDYSMVGFLLCSYVLAKYCDERFINAWWSVGYHYNWKNIYKFRKRAYIWEDFFEYLHLRSRLALYPLYFSFVLFCASTSLLLYVYYCFFFHPIVTWNGYFSDMIIIFHFPSFFDYFMSYTTSTREHLVLSFDYFLAIDGLNIWLIWLTSLLVYLSALYLLDTVKLHSFIAQLNWIFLLAFASFQFFCVPSYFWMYVFFELSLLPIFVLIIFWGSNRRKIHAAYQMVLFTFIGSMFLLTAIFLIYIKIHSFNTFDVFFVTQADTANSVFSSFEKRLIWLFLFIGFAVKTPLYPFHIWLPEAHSEAPTTGSVMLAGVLLKMGTYGFLRFVVPLFPVVLDTFKTLIFGMCMCGIILSSLAALSQVDIKKIIAYSSIGHMGLVILGICTMTPNGLLGAGYMMLSHGLISSALFFSIGLLYKIYGTWSLIYYSSIAHFMPWFSMGFFVFSLANMSFPGTAGFPGEILIFTSLMQNNFFLAFLVGIGSIFGGIYSIWLLTRVLYGQITSKISVYRDLKPSEWKIINFLFLLIILFGIFPFFVLDIMKPMCNFFVLKTF